MKRSIKNITTEIITKSLNSKFYWSRDKIYSHFMKIHIGTILRIFFPSFSRIKIFLFQKLLRNLFILKIIYSLFKVLEIETLFFSYLLHVLWHICWENNHFSPCIFIACVASSSVSLYSSLRSRRMYWIWSARVAQFLFNQVCQFSPNFGWLAERYITTNNDWHIVPQASYSLFLMYFYYILLVIY